MKTILLIFLLACTELWAQPSALSPAPATNPVPPEEIIPAGTITFRGVDLEQVLDIYAGYVNRTILRSPTLPMQAKIFLTTQTPLTKGEVIEALNAVLALNGISMVNFGDKFVKAVGVAEAPGAGQLISTNDPSTYPELGSYVTHVVQLKYVQPGEMLKVIQPFAKLQGQTLAIDASMILVLRDYTENVKRMLEMIKQVDVEVPSEILSEVIPMKYAKASEIAGALSSLGGGGGGTSIGAASRGGAGITGRSGGGGMNRGGIPGYPGASMGNPQPITAPGGAGAGGGASLQNRLAQIVNRAAGAGEFQILGYTKIIADERMNALLVFAGKQDMQMIKSIVEKLDTVLQQVIIEAIVMEVSLNDSKSIGFSYLQKQARQVGNFTGIGAINNGPFLTPNNFMSGLSNAAASVPSGFSYLGSFGNDFDVTMTAIANDGRINVLSTPRIQTSHAVPASIQIGQSVPFVSGTYAGAYGGTGFSSQYQNQFVGIELDVTPYINPVGLVTMEIVQNISQLGTPVQIDNNQVPTTVTRNANATVSIKDGDTVMLGGFISTTKTKSRSGVPFLKDIPLLGALFSSTSDSNQRVELIVLIRPTVLPTPEAAARAATAAQNKLPGVRQAVKEIEADDNKRLKKAEKNLGPARQENSGRDTQGSPPPP